jgi:cytochrome P450
MTTASTKQLINDAAQDIIDNAAAENKSELNKVSLIHMMLSAMEKDDSSGGRNSLSLQELKDEVKMFIIAGHETSSTLCYWAL